jgi:uncharacterized membrane protein
MGFKLQYNMNKKEVKKTNNKKKPIFPTIPRTIGQKASDLLTKAVGSWVFIIFLLIFIAAWIYLNITAYIKQWDPWPFIILNLCLSCLAAIQAPIILMSQNRQTERDRHRAEYDYTVNRKAEREIREIQKQLNRIERVMMKRHPKK